MNDSAGAMTDTGTSDAAAAELSAWRAELDSAALIGTARRAAPAPPAALAVAAPADRGREPLVLDLGAFDDVVGRTDPRLAHAVPVAPAESDERPDAPSDAVRVLEELLRRAVAQGVPKASADLLLGAWLEAAERQRVVVPPRLLPELFRFDPACGTHDLVPALGARGAWLRALEGHVPEPSTDGPEDPAALAERLRTLSPSGAFTAVQRAGGAQSAALVDAIRPVWRTLPADVRSHIVSGLLTGAAGPSGVDSAIDPSSEAFLEECLDDRAGSVREAAQHALMRSQDSAYAGRMASRLREIIEVERDAQGRVRVSLRTPVVADDADEKRDGLLANTRGKGPNLEAWVRIMLFAAPLSVWTDVIPGTIDEVVPLVLEALTPEQRKRVQQAVMHQNAVPWARVLIETGTSGSLLQVIPQPERGRLALERVHERARRGEIPADELRAIPGPWSDELGTLVLDLAVPAPPPPPRADGRTERTIVPWWFDVPRGLPSRIPVSLEPRMHELIAVQRDDHGYDAFRRILVAELRIRELQAAIDGAFA